MQTLQASTSKYGRVRMNQSHFRELRTPGQFVGDEVFELFLRIFRRYETIVPESKTLGGIELSVLEVMRETQSMEVLSPDVMQHVPFCGKTHILSASSSSTSSAIVGPRFPVRQAHHLCGNHYVLSYTDGKGRIHMADSKLPDAQFAIPRLSSRRRKKTFTSANSVFVLARQQVLNEIQMLYGKDQPIIIDPMPKQSGTGNNCLLHVLIYLIHLYRYPNVPLHTIQLQDDSTLRDEFTKAYLRMLDDREADLIMKQLYDHCVDKSVQHRRSKCWYIDWNTDKETVQASIRKLDA